MRARITSFDVEHRIQRLRTAAGQERAVRAGSRMKLEVVEVTPDDAIGRFEPTTEIIMAPVPARAADLELVGEASMARWLEDAASDERDRETDLGKAVELLVPEVVALRREVARLAEEVERRRRWMERPATDILKELAARMEMSVEAVDGGIVLKPIPEDPDYFEDYFED